MSVLVAAFGVSMKRWKWALLIFELALFALILVLPQVDLPDFTCHGGTAPVAAKARASQVPTVIALVRAAITTPLTQPAETRFENSGPPLNHGLHYRLSLLCTLLV